MIVQNSIFPAAEKSLMPIRNEKSSSMWTYMKENFDLAFVLYICYA